MNTTKAIGKAARSRCQSSSRSAVTNLKNIVTRQIVHRQDRQEEFTKSLAHIQYLEAQHAISIMLEAVCDLDINALDGFIESGMLYNPSFTREQMENLWEKCWQLWSEYNSTEQATLGVFMSCLKAAYPALPNHPAWVVIGNIEER